MLENNKAQGTYEIEIQVNGKKKYRKAQLSIIYEAITIPPPPPNKTVRKDGENLPNVEVWSIMAIERTSPKDIEGVKWVLITNIPIKTLKDAIEKVIWYSYRWNIEIFHKILKSGCSVEKAQLPYGKRLKKYIIM